MRMPEKVAINRCPDIEGKTIEKACVVEKAMTHDQEVFIQFTDGTTCNIGVYRPGDAPTRFYIDVTL